MPQKSRLTISERANLIRKHFKSLVFRLLLPSTGFPVDRNNVSKVPTPDCRARKSDSQTYKKLRFFRSLFPMTRLPINGNTAPKVPTPDCRACKSDSQASQMSCFSIIVPIDRISGQWEQCPKNPDPRLLGAQTWLASISNVWFFNHCSH